jgi:hypothetical protein
MEEPWSDLAVESSKPEHAPSRRKLFTIPLVYHTDDLEVVIKVDMYKRRHSLAWLTLAINGQGQHYAARLTLFVLNNLAVYTYF